MIQAARNTKAYAGWDAKRVDEILLFKIYMAAYLNELETALGKLSIGSSWTKVLDAIHAQPYETGDHSINSSIIDDISKNLNTNSTLFGGETQANRGFEKMADKSQRTRLIIDAHIFYKILQIHLGTPWLASLPHNDATERSVRIAVTDALMTIMLSRYCSGKQQILPLSRYLYASPTLTAYWSNLYGTREKLEELSVQYDDVNDLLVTFPLWEHDGHDVERQRLLAVQLHERCEKFASYLNASIKTESRFQNQKLRKFWDELNVRLDNVCNVYWTSTAELSKTNEITRSQFDKYVEWIEQRRGNFSSFRAQSEAIDQILNEAKKAKANEKRTSSSIAHAKLLDCVDAQQLGMELLANNIVEPVEVLELMHKTIKELVYHVAGVQNSIKLMDAVKKKPAGNTSVGSDDGEWKLSGDLSENAPVGRANQLSRPEVQGESTKAKNKFVIKSSGPK
jgi:hypothetical protein